MELIMCVSVVLTIALFACFAFGYKEGLRLGMRSAKGIEPKPIKNPVKAVKEAVEQNKIKKEVAEQESIYEAIERNDGYTEAERELMRGGGRK